MTIEQILAMSSGAQNVAGQVTDWRNYTDEIKELAQKALTSDDPVERENIAIRIEEIQEAVGKKDSERVDRLFSSYTMAGAAGVAEAESGGEFGSLEEDQKKVFEKAAKGGTVLGLLKTGIGIYQIIDSVAKKNKLTPPKMPQMLNKNPQLQNLIAQTMVRAEQGDQQLQKVFDSKLVENRAARNQLARSSGNIGNFISNVQAGNISDNQAAQNFTAQQSQEKNRASQQLASLLGQSMREDQNIQRDNWQRFNNLNDAYRSNVNALQMQENSGVANAFGGLQDMANNAPFLNLNRNRSMNDLGMPNERVPSAAPMPIEANRINEVQSVNPVQPLNIGDMMMLGNPAYQTPDRVGAFQSMMEQQGKLNGYTPGEWDPVTQDAYNDIYFSK